ncbi:MAG: N-acetyl-glucosamine-6-phosphate deacetylase [Bogoriella megaspora]|nr:MAG: N-acetyl-glucosamine-6-phosphate deacetylase [Bogoriella megaspora]
MNESRLLDASERDILQAAFEWTKSTILDIRFVPRKFHARGAIFEPQITEEQALISEVNILITSSQAFSNFEDSFAHEEAYSLNMSKDGQVLITASSLAGSLHSLQTFTQLFYSHTESLGGRYTPLAPVSIVDGPSFRHRGLNLDISRNWIPPSDVLRTIDGMAINKMNRLHIHASDAQSWPLEVLDLPDLALKGAYDPVQIWSAQDLEQVQQYGRRRGVEVILEIDIPGHTTSIALAYPELIAAANQEPWPTYAEEPPAGQLRLNSIQVQAFLGTLFRELLPRNSLSSNLFHFGGDELNKNVYSVDPAVNSSTKVTLQPFVQTLMDQVFELADEYNVTPIVWEEMLLEWNLELPKSTIIQTWRSNEALTHVLREGHRVIFGANTHWYLDCGHGAFLDPVDPLQPGSDQRVQPPYLDYCGPYKNWRHIYSYNPLLGVPHNQRHLILGGEVHMWGEMTDSVSLDGMLWPRAAAAAEVLWRGTGNPVSEDTTRRLAEMREHLVLRQIGAGVVQMEWCLRNAGRCTI